MEGKDKALKTPTVLAFERKLDVSDGLFYAGNWATRHDKNSWKEIFVTEKALRGTISNRLAAKDSDPAKLNAKIDKANLQTVDVASLPMECDTLKFTFTLRVIGNIGEPSVCNNSDYRTKIKVIVDDYIKSHSFAELSKRYAYNLANARFLWRNRIGAEEIEVVIHEIKNGQVVSRFSFESLNYSLNHFEIENNTNNELNALSKIINRGLSNEGYTLLEVIAYARVGRGQEIFPSQELVLEKSSKKGDKSKHLYQLNHIAAMHSQKIGNAIRTIDSWYPQLDGMVYPIAVEPYGSVTTQGVAYRQPKEKIDFFNLLDNWILKDKIPETGNCHFVIANLIRGGVFGESEKKEKG